MEIRNQVAIESRSNGIGQKLNEDLSLLAKACAKKAAKLGYLDEGILLEPAISLYGLQSPYLVNYDGFIYLKRPAKSTCGEDSEDRQ